MTEPGEARMTGLCQDCYGGLDAEIDHSVTLCIACQTRRARDAEAAATERRAARYSQAVLWQQLGPKPEGSTSAEREWAEAERERREIDQERREIMARQRAIAAAAPQLRGFAPNADPQAVAVRLPGQRRTYRPWAH